jgi:cyanophycinase-like exopeptidase
MEMKRQGEPMTGPGLLVLIGSGETGAVGGQVIETAVSRGPQPSSIGILETPAGFELNSAQVAGRVKSFLTKRLSNYRPALNLIPARKREGPGGTDDLGMAELVLAADLLFMGAGSPSYAVRQLKNSLVWQAVRAKHAYGMPFVLASAAVIAVGRLALPVYEIYKVGEEPHWKDGLDLLGEMGLNLVFIPHWNNNDGGDELDTSRCFMGRERFEVLAVSLNPTLRILGIDENTALSIDFQAQACQVSGSGQVHILHLGQEYTFTKGESFALSYLGSYRGGDWPADLSHEWQARVLAAQKASEKEDEVPRQIQELVSLRLQARAAADWKQADVLRGQIRELGWTVTDTREGSLVNKT